jgi:hypothetical protein
LLALAFIQRPALAQALGFGQPGQGFIFFHLLQNRCCIIRSYLLQTVISKGDTDMTREYLTHKIETARAAIAFAVPGADTSYAKATLAFAEAKLAKLEAK